MGRRGYPSEFRRRVLDVIASGRKVHEVALDLGISDQTIYIWRRQERIDRGEASGPTSTELAELSAARRRITELETELAIHRPGGRAAKGERRPKRRYAAIKVMSAEVLPIQLACRVLGVSESGFHAWRMRAPSVRTIRHALLTDMIRKAHLDSHGIYGARRIRAELTLGRGATVGHGTAELLMRLAGVRGISGRPRFRRVLNIATAADLVDRKFQRDEPDRLWVTDITEHRTSEGKVYCAVVLDVFSRRVLGRSIDGSPTTSLVTNALLGKSGRTTQRS